MVTPTIHATEEKERRAERQTEDTTSQSKSAGSGQTAHKVLIRQGGQHQAVFAARRLGDQGEPVTNRP